MIYAILIGFGFIFGIAANYLFRANRTVYTNRIPDFKYTSMPPEKESVKKVRPNTTTSIKVTWI